MEVVPENLRLFNLLSRFEDSLDLPKVTKLFSKDVVFFNQQVSAFNGRKRYKNFLGNFMYVDAENGKLVFATGCSNEYFFGSITASIDMHEAKNLYLVGLTTDEIDDDEKVWGKIEEIWRKFKTFFPDFPFPRISTHEESVAQKYVPDAVRFINDIENMYCDFIKFENMIPGKIYYTLLKHISLKGGCVTVLKLYRACLHVAKENPSPNFLGLEPLCSVERRYDEGKITSTILSGKIIEVHLSNKVGEFPISLEA